MILGVFGLAPSLPRASVCESVYNFAVLFGFLFLFYHKRLLQMELLSFYFL